MCTMLKLSENTSTLKEEMELLQKQDCYGAQRGEQGVTGAMNRQWSLVKGPMNFLFQPNSTEKNKLMVLLNL